MHNDLAWAVLGVDPATRTAVENAAKKAGVSIGRWLELIIAETRAAAAERASIELAFRQREQQLRDILADMAESLMAAADIVKMNRAQPSESNERTAEIKAPNRDAAARADADAPNVEDIQAWKGRLEENTQPSAGRSIRRMLRRSA